MDDYISICDMCMNQELLKYEEGCNDDCCEVARQLLIDKNEDDKLERDLDIQDNRL